MYRFYSQATADLLMVDEVTQWVLQGWNKPWGHQEGILVAADIPSAKQALLTPPPPPTPHIKDDDHDQTEIIPMQTRLYPLLKMMDQCIQANEPLLWKKIT